VGLNKRRRVNTPSTIHHEHVLNTLRTIMRPSCGHPMLFKQT